MRGLAAKTGIAAIRPAPAVTAPWLEPGGIQVPVAPGGTSFLPAGYVANSTLLLPPGHYEISLSYQSAADLTLQIGHAVARLTATLEPTGALLRVLVIASSGARLPVQLSVPRTPAPIPIRGALVRQLHAVAMGHPDRTVPLHAACGRYVDWYELTPPR